MAPARIPLVAPLVAALLAVSPGSVAGAAEVRLDRLQFDCTRTMCPPNYSERLVVRAGRGESNRLSVTRGTAGEFQVTEAGARLHAGPGCAPTGEQRVDCQTSSPILTAFVFAGDRDDTVSSSVAVSIDGGSGNDRLTGSSVADALYGNEGKDVLRGEGGDDALLDGRLLTLTWPEWVGSDYPPFRRTRFAAVSPERDVFDGGEGTDSLRYTGRLHGVIADLAHRGRHAGERGEGDSLRGLEGVHGGNGDDRLLGTESANLMSGGAGDDLLVGRAGNDELEVDAGSNRARGGAGDDTIGIVGNAAPESERQRVACGSGQDRVSSLFRYDFAEDDCESVVIGEYMPLQVLLPPASWQRPPLASYSTQPVACHAPSCRLSLEVRLARSPSRRRPDLKGLLLGRASAEIPFRALTTLTVQLSSRGSRLLRRHRSLLIRISLTNFIPSDPKFRAAGAYLTRLCAPAG
jgi:RTX calcium-binding nonapeptide repeat (4 copies)